jgi:hypothetical protein
MALLNAASPATTGKALRTLTIGALAALAGCQTPAPSPVAPPAGPAGPIFTATAFNAIPGWNEDRPEAAWPAFRVGCAALVKR